jgi:hypothetical protein
LEMGVSRTIYPRWPQTVILPISASQVARITDVSFQYSALSPLLALWPERKGARSRSSTSQNWKVDHWTLTLKASLQLKSYSLLSLHHTNVKPPP